MKTKNPRQAALDILLRIEREDSYADLLLDRELAKGAVQGPDRGLLAELVFGVLRRRATLDHVIDSFSDRKMGKLERNVVMLLRLGLYQELFLNRIPVSAAVNETVKLAKIHVPRAAGFINAVLRRADREREAIPWPDRSADFGAFLAARYSHPRWLVDQWTAQLGTAEAENLAAAMVEPPPLTIRVNTLKIYREELLSKLVSAGIPARTTEYSPVGIHILASVRPAMLEGFQDGLFTVQDESSQLAALFLSPEPGQQVLDLCAAPGGKATHLAQLMNDTGSLVACDRDGRKLGRIEETAGRLGISIITTMPLDAALPLSAFGTRRFDRILVDAPCSGLGVIRRNPEAKWRLTPADIPRLAHVQRTILCNAAELLATDGMMLYSTCSTSWDENEGVLQDFLSVRKDFMVEDLRKVFPGHSNLFSEPGIFRSWPHRHGMDGFCAVRLRKRT